LLYVLIGEDDYSINQSLEDIKRGIGDQALLSTNTTTLDGQDMTLDQLRTVCETVPFLAEKRLVIVNGLLGRFEPKSKSSRQKKATRKSNQKNESESLGAYMGEIPDSTILVLIDGKLKSNNPLLKEISAKSKMKSFPLLRDNELRPWIQRRIKEEGGNISPQAVATLARFAGSNLWFMSNEISKLLLFAAGRRIEEDDVTAVVSYTHEVNVFAMIDAIIACKAATAQQSLQQLLQRGAAPVQLLVMLSRQFRMIARAKELLNNRKSKIEIQNKLGLASEFALRKTLDQANKYSGEQLIEIYHRLLEADLSIKTGIYEGDLALNILIAELCQLRKI